MAYSTPKSQGDLFNSGSSMGDWTCTKCCTHNFKRRERCFRCSIHRYQSNPALDTSNDDGTDQVGSTPCNTLIIRNLDALTTEENITKAFQQVTAADVKRCHVMRDTVTGVSKCYGLVEFASAAHCAHILEKNLNKQSIFEIDGKGVAVDYCRNTFATVMASIEYHKKVLEQQMQSAPGSNHSSAVAPTGVSTTDNSANEAAAVAQAALRLKLAYNQQHASTSIVKTTANSSATAVGTATTATTAGTLASVPEPTRAPPTNPFDYSTYHQTTYPEPDTSKYVLDPVSRYYYDPITGLYYDANTKYFYDSKSQQFLVWDGSRHTYLPMYVYQQQFAEEQNKQMIEAPNTMPTGEMGIKKKPKSAKKIAKEMDKWAKRVNKQREIRKELQVTETIVPPVPTTALKPSVAAPSLVSSSKSADAGFAILAGGGNATSAGRSTGPSLLIGGMTTSIVGSQYDSDPDDHAGVATMEEVPAAIPCTLIDPSVRLKEAEEKQIDYDKKACLLCSRGFSDLEKLQKHRELSDLHKKNLEALRTKLGLPPGEDPATVSMKAALAHASHLEGTLGLGTVAPPAGYRDRAKERRQKVGISSPPRYSSSWRRGGEPPSPPAAPVPTGPVYGQNDAPGMDANIGSKLMAKMGWQDGQGLGKSNQGRTTVIEAESRVQGVGLGAKGSRTRLDPSGCDNYKQKVKQAMLQRYKELS